MVMEPSSLESALVSHLSVAEAAVIGIPHEIKGQGIYAFVTLKAGLLACRRPPVVNYVSLDKERLEETFPIAARYGAEVILFIADPIAPSSIEDFLKSAAVLVGAANESGISNDHILIDPGVLHVTSDIGQRYTKTLLELLPALSETFDPFDPIVISTMVAKTKGTMIFEDSLVTCYFQTAAALPLYHP
jgi:hypothetical protein